jgi:hypothetical protein
MILPSEQDRQSIQARKSTHGRGTRISESPPMGRIPGTGVQRPRCYATIIAAAVIVQEMRHETSMSYGNGRSVTARNPDRTLQPPLDSRAWASHLSIHPVSLRTSQWLDHPWHALDSNLRLGSILSRAPGSLLYNPCRRPKLCDRCPASFPGGQFSLAQLPFVTSRESQSAQWQAMRSRVYTPSPMSSRALGGARAILMISPWQSWGKSKSSGYVADKLPLKQDGAREV